MSSRPLNEAPWDKKEDREKGFRQGGGLGGRVWAALRSRERVDGGTALSPAKPVESQMPLYPWPHCAFASKSLSSISLIRGRSLGVGMGGRNHWARREGGGLPEPPRIALMSQLPCWLLSFGSYG